MNNLTTIVDEAQRLDSMAHRMSPNSTVFRDELDKFLALLLKSEEGEARRADLSPVFLRRYKLCTKDLSSLGSIAVPLAIIRELVATHHVVLKKSTFRNWEPFVARYREAIYA